MRHIGVSNFDVEQLRRIQQIAPVETLQPQYSLIERDVEREILPFAEREGIGVIVYSPMGSGMLSGGMTRERVESLADDDWRKHDPALQRAPAVAQPRAGRAPAGGRRALRHHPGRDRGRLDAAQSRRRRRDRRLPSPRPGRPDPPRREPRAHRRGHRRDRSVGRYRLVHGSVRSADDGRIGSASDVRTAIAKPKEAGTDGHDHHDRRHGDLLQGLGIGPADRLQPRLAAVGRRLGHPDAVLPAARVPGDRPRPARARPLDPDQRRSRHGPLRRRSGGA